MNIYHNFVDGEWLLSTSSQRHLNTNPANVRDVLGELPLSTPNEVVVSTEAAKNAFQTWRKLPAPQRGAIVTRAAHIMQARRDELARTLSREEGKLLSEAQGEITQAINTIEFCGNQGWRLAGATIPSESVDSFGYTMKQPLGCVAIITSWNIPVATPSRKIAAALVTGNTVVFKPSPFVPETAEGVLRCFIEAGLPPGVLNMVHGDHETGIALIEAAETQLVSYTGSTSSGLAVHERAARRGIRVQCNTRGHNVMIVLEDADIDLAVAGVTASAFGATGQSATSTDWVILAHPVADAFLERLVNTTCAMQLGAGVQDGIAMGPCVNEQQMRDSLTYIEAGIAQGATLLCGGSRVIEGDLQHGFFVSPTVLDRVRTEMSIVNQKILGPVLSVFRVENFDEAMMVANKAQQSLVSGIYTRDTSRIFRYIDGIQALTTYVNSRTPGNIPQTPFDDAQLPGSGAHSLGSELFDAYMSTKVTYIDYTSRSE
ncbi:MAG: aldehyde dehydrogenase family protein [Chloroflexota bacterium]